MLRGLEDYKLRWRPDVVVQERVLLSRPGPLAGAGHPAAVRARSALVRFAKDQLPWARDLRDRARRRSPAPAPVGDGRSAGSGRSVHVLGEPAEVERWLTAWDRVPATTDPVGGAAWTQAWLDVYGGDHRLAVSVDGQPAAPRAVVPLVRRAGRPWWLETLGVRQLAEPTDVRVAEPAALRAAVEEVARSRRALRLKRLPADSPLLPEIRSVYGRRAVVMARPVEGTPTISLDDSWSAPESKLSSRRRGDLRAARRRASGLGSVELDVAAPTPPEFAPLFDDFLTVEASGWKTAAGTALAVQPQMQQFYRRFGELAAERGELRLAFLRIDGRPVAGQLAIEHAGRYSLLKIGFDEAFARCSPGNLLMVHALGWAADRRLASFEFLGVSEPWIGLWTQEIRPCIEVHVYPLTPWGALATADMAAELLRRGVRRGLSAVTGRSDSKEG
jgi:CelD/BcsL family acetyltransferase involved in cellulose biosynthesis